MNKYRVVEATFGNGTKRFYPEYKTPGSDNYVPIMSRGESSLEDAVKLVNAHRAMSVVKWEYHNIE